MALDHTFVNVITGATGSGKTSLIAALLALRPEGGRWAVLTNDFGATTLGGGPRAVVPVYREQISAADVVVLTGADAVSSEDRAAAWSVLAQIVLAGARVIDDLREVDVSVLDGRPR